MEIRKFEITPAIKAFVKKEQQQFKEDHFINQNKYERLSELACAGCESIERCDAYLNDITEICSENRQSMEELYIYFQELICK